MKLYTKEEETNTIQINKICPEKYIIVLKLCVIHCSMFSCEYFYRYSSNYFSRFWDI